MQCTWVDPPERQCADEGTHEELDNVGQPWAHLCDKHHGMIHSAIATAKAKTDVRILKYWVRAQGALLRARRVM
jgi:hypothetical protein